MINLLLSLMILAAPFQDNYREHTITDEFNNTLALRYYSPPFNGAPTVIICHDWAGNQDNWSDVAISLEKLGFGVILYNLKGHGQERTPYYLFANWQIERLGKDLDLAVTFAVRNAGDNVYVIGAGLGANIAMNLAADDKRIKKLVAVSPGMNYRGIKLNKSMTESLKGRLMMIASQEDAYSVRTIKLFTSNSEIPAETNFYSNSGRGVWIFKRQPESLATVARWLSGSE